MADPLPARQALAQFEALLRDVAALESLPNGLAADVRMKVGAIRHALALSQVESIEATRLRETAKGLRIDALVNRGYKTVGQILRSNEYQLRGVSGVGENTARQVIGAAQQVLLATERAVRLHFDVVARQPAQTELLVQLRRYEIARRTLDHQQSTISWARTALAPIAESARPAGAGWLRRTFSGGSAKAEAAQATSNLIQLLAHPRAVEFANAVHAALAEVNRPRSPVEAWSDYEHNAAQLLGVLGEITGSSDDPANQGHLPAEIVKRVQALDLDRTFLTASLRGYQAFGAKFALVQRRTVLGDEMGLGKTLEALAAMCHLRAAGRTHFLVVCPASVVANWRTETRRHTKLEAHVVHGADRDHAHRAWKRHGGVAITTFDGLRRLDVPIGDDSPWGASLPALVVDEAHYVKNPATIRAKNVGLWASAAERVIFLTGTPMENRVEEFRSLIAHLQPEIAHRVNPTTALAGPAAFQSAVAPAYLRRNQTDVLDELPGIIPSFDWVEPTPDDEHAYRDAVGSAAFQTMRRAAFASIPDGGPADVETAIRSAKVARLVDLIEEAALEGLKVVVFSYFRAVLEIAHRAAELAVPGAVFGPLTGSTPVHERQRLVDALTATPGSAVLVAQIEAGGVGLNIQAASVVILCEPQWKPTIEQQAIARCHRMGQVRRVMAHRLLLEDTVDQRMLEILVNKQRLIDQFVSESAIKDIAPESIDISDLDAVEKAVNEAQAEQLIIDSERRRLGLV